MRIDAESRNHSPESEPQHADEKNPLVAKEIPQSAGNENKGPRGQAIASNKLRKYTWVRDTEAVADLMQDAKCLR